MNLAFDEDEIEHILETTVQPHKNPEYNKEREKSTQDKVFLLSIEEAYQYFKGDNERCCKPSNTARNNGVFVVNNGNCRWWLRSVGRNQWNATCISYLGDVYKFGNDVDVDRYGVRPAMWIEIPK